MNVTLFNPHVGQRKVIDGFADSNHKFAVVATGRQFGKSLLAQNLLLYWLLGSNNQKGAWISPIYNQCKKVFQELLDAAHPLIVQSNKADLTMTFVNGSTITFLSAERYDSIRGFSFNYMVIDECAFIREQAINEAIFPTLSAIGKKCLMISTPKSKNWFYNAYLKGLNGGDDYISFSAISTDNPHIDASFIAEQAKSLPEQIYRQEYLAEFTDAGSDVFTNVENVCILNGWEQPQSHKRYFCGIDFGLQNDYSVLTIMDEAGRVCFIDRVNGSSYAEIASRFSVHLRSYKISGGYAETNGPGLPIFEMLSKETRKLQGFVTTNESKNNGVRSLIYAIQEGSVMLPSKDYFPALYHELNAYSYKITANGNVSFNAPNGTHDDCVMSLMLCNEARSKLAFQKGGLYIGDMTKKRYV